MNHSYFFSLKKKDSNKIKRNVISLTLAVSTLLLVACNQNSNNAKTPVKELESIASINKLVIFGDSLSDNGTLRQLTSTQPQPAPEFFSNGPVWPNYLSDKLGVPQVNLAVAGARSVGHDSAPLQTAAQSGAFSALGYTTGLGLRGQVDNYINNNTAVDQQNVLHTILIGGNDILAYLNGLVAGSEAIPSSVDVSNAIADTVTESVGRLVANGAKNIVVFTLPELSDVPRLDVSGFSDYQTEITSLIQTLNNKLVSDLNTQRVAASSPYNIITFNTYRATNNARDSGDFTNVDDSWLVVDNNLQPTGATNGPVEEFLFWDTIHPTTAAHKMLAEQLFQTLKLQEHCLGNDNCRVSSGLGME
ncbi:SGNH/GDSL hydrolase family protein [Pelagibaculum spongiae]|nr:SGNH/GDSL hydrolase family protein [Pelagibaculum spongiae]